MTLKKLFLLTVLSFSFLCIPESAAERRKPLILHELQNPKSPSYVPIPYPKNDKEVIADLKYFFRKELNSQENIVFSGKKFPSREKIMRNFMVGKDVLVGEILKIKNDVSGRERDYTFLVRLRNRENIWLSNISLDANGLFLRMNFLDFDNLKSRGVKKYMIFQPYADRLSIKKELKESIGYDLNENEFNKMQLVDGLCQVANSLFPAWEMPLSDGRIFLRSYYDNRLYQVEYKLDTNSEDFKADSMAALNKKEYQHFIRSTKNEIVMLRKVRGQK
jgi:hypothetical protein